jgi:steroid delta-isomerase-like uncharacterized protein
METDWLAAYLDAWNSHDAGRVAAFMAENATYEDLALGRLHKGRDEIQGFIAEAEQFSADYRFVSVSAQASADQYALEWEMVGTNTGAAGPLPATNKPYRVRGCSIGRLDAEGKITENRDYWNLADYLSQVGLFAPPAP